MSDAEQIGIGSGAAPGGFSQSLEIEGFRFSPGVHYIEQRGHSQTAAG